MTTDRRDLMGRWTIVGVLSALALCGCERRAPSTPPTPATGSTTAVGGPMEGVRPQTSDAPASSAHGPGGGETAVGGMTSNQDGGGANHGSKPAPTGGDGAASGGR